MYDLSKPEHRAAAIEALGPEGYNKAMAEYRQRMIVCTEAGHPIFRIENTRFGTLFGVGDTGNAFGHLANAIAHARANPIKEETSA